MSTDTLDVPATSVPSTPHRITTDDTASDYSARHEVNA